MKDTSNQMKKETPILTIELDKDKIKAEIATKGVYEEDGVTIKNWEGDKDSEYYIGTIKKEKYSYSGVLNIRLKRHQVGVNHYDNGDIHFGFFDQDVRHQHGAYLYAPEVKDGYVLSEMYQGFWRDNIKDKNGIYVWIKEKEGEEDITKVDMDAFVGEIELDNFKRGVIITKIGESFYVYYGNFDQNGKKTDDHAFYYDYTQDKIFLGKIENDKFVNGHLAQFDEDGLKNLIYLEFNEDAQPLRFVKNEDIDEAIKNEILIKINKFRDYALEVDYFAMIYNKFKEINKYVNKEMTDISILNSDDGFPKIMKVLSSYNDIRVYNILEKQLRK